MGLATRARLRLRLRLLSLRIGSHRLLWLAVGGTVLRARLLTRRACLALRWRLPLLLLLLARFLFLLFLLLQLLQLPLVLLSLPSVPSLSLRRRGLGCFLP